MYRGIKLIHAAFYFIGNRRCGQLGAAYDADTLSGSFAKDAVAKRRSDRLGRDKQRAVRYLCRNGHLSFFAVDERSLAVCAQNDAVAAFCQRRLILLHAAQGAECRRNAVCRHYDIVFTGSRRAYGDSLFIDLSFTVDDQLNAVRIAVCRIACHRYDKE